MGPYIHLNFSYIYIKYLRTHMTKLFIALLLANILFYNSVILLSIAIILMYFTYNMWSTLCIYFSQDNRSYLLSLSMTISLVIILSFICYKYIDFHEIIRHFSREYCNLRFNTVISKVIVFSHFSVLVFGKLITTIMWLFTLKSFAFCLLMFMSLTLTIFFIVSFSPRNAITNYSKALKNVNKMHLLCFIIWNYFLFINLRLYVHTLVNVLIDQPVVPVFMKIITWGLIYILLHISNVNLLKTSFILNANAPLALLCGFVIPTHFFNLENITNHTVSRPVCSMFPAQAPINSLEFSNDDVFLNTNYPPDANHDVYNTADTRNRGTQVNRGFRIPGNHYINLNVAKSSVKAINIERLYPRHVFEASTNPIIMDSVMSGAKGVPGTATGTGTGTSGETRPPLNTCVGTFINNCMSKDDLVLGPHFTDRTGAVLSTRVSNILDHSIILVKSARGEALLNFDQLVQSCDRKNSIRPIYCALWKGNQFMPFEYHKNWHSDNGYVHKSRHQGLIALRLEPDGIRLVDQENMNLPQIQSYNTSTRSGFMATSIILKYMSLHENPQPVDVNLARITSKELEPVYGNIPNEHDDTVYSNYSKRFIAYDRLYVSEDQRMYSNSIILKELQLLAEKSMMNPSLYPELLNRNPLMIDYNGSFVEGRYISSQNTSIVFVSSRSDNIA